MAEKDSLVKVRARCGEPFTIRIWEDRTRGSRWMPSFDSALFRLINDDFDPTRNIRVSDIGMRHFVFLPMQAGRFEMVFESRYGWKFSADGRLTYEIEVS